MQHLQPNTTISYAQPHISYNERENVWDIVEKEVSLQKIAIGNRRGYEEGYSYVVSGLDSLSRGRDAAAHKNPEPCGGVWTGEL